MRTYGIAVLFFTASSSLPSDKSSLEKDDLSVSSHKHQIF